MGKPHFTYLALVRAWGPGSVLGSSGVNLFLCPKKVSYAVIISQTLDRADRLAFLQRIDKCDTNHTNRSDCRQCEFLSEAKAMCTLFSDTWFAPVSRKMAI